MAVELCIQPVRTQSIALASFGTATASYQELGMATVETKMLLGELIPVSVLIIPSIAAPIQSAVNSSVHGRRHRSGWSGFDLTTFQGQVVQDNLLANKLFYTAINFIVILVLYTHLK